jgi:hypothetical protein
MMDKVLNQSRLAQITLVGTGIFPSARRVLSQVDPTLVDQAARHYLRARDAMEALCRHYGVQCIFILQPLAVFDGNPIGSTAAIVQQDLIYFPYDRELFTLGYNLIRTNNGTNHLDASRLLDGRVDAYVDVVHLSKIGNAIVGKFIYICRHEGARRGSASVGYC